MSMGGKRVKFYIERNSFGVQAMVILLSLSIVFRIIGCWGLWTDRNFLMLQIVLPVFSALLMIASVLLLGKRALWISFIPVLLGAVFFIIKSLGFESMLHTILCIVLYVAVIVLYFCTVFGILPTKWVLVILFGLPFLYHIFVEDLAALRDTENPVSFAAGMQEMGVLCIMLGLFFLSLSMKKTVIEKETVAGELPKMKGPKVLFPKKKEDSGSVQIAEENQSESDDKLNTVSPVSFAVDGAKRPAEVHAVENEAVFGEGDGTLK